MTAFVIPEAEWNTLSARFVTLAGMRMSPIPWQLSNARVPILRIVSGIWKVLMADLPENALSPIAVTLYVTPSFSTDDGKMSVSGTVPESPVTVASRIVSS